jgi:hypothetical protein
VVGVFEAHANLCIAMKPEQRKFLQGRLQRAVAEQPEFEHLKLLLLRFGGDFIVAPNKLDQDVPRLLKYGFLMNGPITFDEMKSSMCHQNVAAVWKFQRPRIVSIATGYALSEDGLWRQHSWGVLREGLLETTAGRMRYFGISLSSSKADHFAACNPYPAKDPQAVSGTLG